jgi:hypothetical protein
MNTIPLRSFKKALVSALCALWLVPTECGALILGVPQCWQEQDQWCWAATSQSVLAFYGTTLTQTQIAQYGTDGANIPDLL